MIADLHSHILPKLDDGSSSSAQSIAMLRQEQAQGISLVAVTPHFYANQDNPERFLERRAHSMERLQEAMAQEQGLPPIVCGAEVHYFPGMSESDSLQRLTYGDSRAILVEMPNGRWTQRMYDELYNIWKRQDLVPVVAHVDRYLGLFQTYGIPEALEELPVMVQANAGFFLRHSSRAMALRMLKRGQIHVLGSDCHNMDSRRPNLGLAVEVIRKYAGEEALLQIQENQRRMFGELG